VDRPKPRARKHRDDRLWYQWKVYSNPVSVPHPEPRERLRCPANFGVELSVSESAGRLRSGTGAVVGFKNDRWLISSGEEMPIETILDNIELSPAKPLNSGLRKIMRKRHIPPFSPKKLLRNLLPELSWVKNALLIFVDISA